MLRLATGERKVILMHCLEDSLCVWRPPSITELSYNLVMIEGHPVWSGRGRYSYGHLLFTNIEEGTYQIEQLQITNSKVIPHGMRCEGLLRVLSLVSFDLPDHYQRTLSMLLQAAGEGCSSLHTVPIEGRDIRDDQISGRQLQHLQPWVSVELVQQLDRGQSGVRLNVTYQYEAYASFHVIQLHTDGAPILLFSDPMAVSQCSPWDLCVAGNLGMESNVMAGRALLGCLQLADGQRRCAIFLVHEKVMQGSSKSAEYRAYRRIAPKSLELVLVSQPVAQTFCGRLQLQHLANAAYFDPGTDWLLTYLQKRHQDLSQGATAQLLVCVTEQRSITNSFNMFPNSMARTLRITTTSSAAGATGRIAKQGVAFLVEGEKVPLLMTERIAMGERQWR